MSNNTFAVMQITQLWGFFSRLIWYPGPNHTVVWFGQYVYMSHFQLYRHTFASYSKCDYSDNSLSTDALNQTLTKTKSHASCVKNVLTLLKMGPT